MNQFSAVVLPLLCLCAFLGGEPFANAKPAIPKEGPPVLVPLELKLVGRVPLRIVLKAQGLQRSPVTFVLRGEAAFGRVRLLKQLAGDSVEVEYVPPADRSIQTDSFHFAGSNAQGFSSDSSVRIQIVDEGPRLTVAQALDFAETRVGKAARLPLEVRNLGDRPGAGQITVSVPWELEEGSDQYSLAPGERKTLGVLFKPTKAGWSHGELRFSGGGAQPVQMRARALDWVELASDPVVFSWSDSKNQKATLVLSNADTEAFELRLEAKPALEHEDNIRLEAGMSLPVPLRWRGDLVPGGWGTLLLTSTTGMQRVVVWSLDATLSGLGPAFVLAGEAGFVGARRTFTNTGGRGGSWRFRCMPPFYLADAAHLPKAAPAAASSHAASVAPTRTLEVHAVIPGFVWDHNQNRYVPSGGAAKTAPVSKAEPKEAPPAVPQGLRATELTRSLQPGESFVLFVGLNGPPPVSGGTLSVAGPGQSRLEPLIVKGEGETKLGSPLSSFSGVRPTATAPLAKPLGAQAATLPTPSAAPTPHREEAPGAAALPSLFSDKKVTAKAQKHATALVAQDLVLPSLLLEGFRVRDVTSDSATISFPAGPGVAPEDLVVRLREIHPVEEGDPRVEWVPFELANSRGNRVGPNIEIRLRGLRPGWANHVDLIGPPSAKGKRSKLYQAEILTPPAVGVFSPERPWPWMAFLTLLGGVYIWRRRSH